MKREYYKSLDAIRGLLALSVVFFHAEWASLLTSNDFSRNGYLAVDVFFCLSGFLMFKLYGSMSSISDVRDFMAKRFARIYPLHLFTLLLMFLYSAMRLGAHKAGIPVIDPGEAIPFSAQSTDNALTFLSNLALTQSMGLHDNLSFNGPAWSISVEFYTYVIFAVVVILTPITKARHVACVGFSGLLIYIGLAVIRPSLDITYDFGFFRCLAGFAAGIVAASVFTWSKPIAAKLSKVSATLIEILVALIFITWFCSVSGRATLTIAPFMIALILVFAHGRGLLSAVMNIGIFQYIGKISYSVYLNHALVLIVVNLFISKGLGGIDNVSSNLGEFISFAYITVVIASSHITYHVIEKPASNLIRQTYQNRFDRSQTLRKRIAALSAKAA